MKKVIVCNLCSSKDSSVIFIEDGIEILKCKNCGLVYSGEISEKTFEREESPEKISEKTRNLRMHIYISVLQELKKKGGGRLLDVGCRTGDFLIDAKKYGFDLTGVEISEKFASYARNRGLNAITGALKEVRFSDELFDVVTYLVVFELISTPSEELKEVYRILKDEGLLVLEIPNLTFNILKAKIFNVLGLKSGLTPLNQLFFYSKETICKMLKKNGFQIESLKPECSVEGCEVAFLPKIYMFLSPLFKTIPFKWIFCNDLIVFARKVTK